MPFTYDVFISYRHLDNIPVSGATGWIDDFTKRLTTQLTFKLGHEPRVWRDPKLGGSDYFERVILKALQQSKILISVLSPGYIDPSSEWCLRELTDFCRLAKQDIGVSIEDKSRCFKIVKTFVAREKHPAELQGLLGYEFFDEDADSDRVRDFSYLSDGYRYNRYLDQIDQLAFDITQMLMAIDSAKSVTTPDRLHTVYIAEATTDRSHYRVSIRNELLSLGF